jgi:AraC-like DNA-binding protein
MRLEIVAGASPLGAWTYVSWRPPELADLVDHLWAYRGPTSHRRKRVFPNGRVELLLNFGDPYRMLEGAGTDVCRAAWVGGPQVGPLVVEQPRHQECLGIRLRPAGAYAVLGCPLREVTGLSVDLTDVLGGGAADLADRCAGARSAPKRFRIVADWLTARLARARGMDEAIAWAVSRLDGSAGAVPIATLRARTGLSKARLASTFREQVGLTPKRYARVVRFHRTLRVLQTAGDCRLAEAAVDGRFYDQAHMNGEFRALGGVTPRAFLAARHPVGDGTTASDGPPER